MRNVSVTIWMMVVTVLCLLNSHTKMLLADAGSAEGTWITFDYPGSDLTRACGIDGGKIVGYYNETMMTRPRGFLYDGATWTLLDAPGAQETSAYDIDGTNIVGEYEDASYTYHGFLWDGVTWTTLDAPDAVKYTRARGIDGENIVGYYHTYESYSYIPHGFLYDGMAWTTLDVPGAIGTHAYDIDGDNIVGSYLDASYNWHGFLYDGVTWITLDAPGAVDTCAYGIDGNNVVGKYSSERFGDFQGFLYDGLKWTTLNAPGAVDTSAYGIDCDKIVGHYSSDGYTTAQAFIYQIPNSFQNPDYWSVFDAPVELPESSLKAYVRAAFDGRFIYFPSYSMGANPSGYFLRYDTHGDFFDGESSWEYYRPDDVLSCDARGYIDAIVVGQYVYFCPYFNNDHHGVMLRYDVTKDFNEPNSWKCFDPSTAKPDADLVGFAGIASDGQYLYFAPRVEVASKVLRYDTNGVFDNVLSWDSFDLKPVVGGTAGYTDCVFDGQYVYLAPFRDGSGYSGKMLRYDTSKTFADSASWETYDVGTPKGFDAAIFDDRHEYVYFVPYYSTDDPGAILRFNTKEAFDDPNSWNSFDAADVLGSDLIGYHDGVFDGRYIYFSPRRDTQVFKEMLRYDTRKDFSDLCSWDTFTPPDLIITDGGYVGGISDGRYVYFSPWRNFSEWYHGKVLRFDAALCGDENHPYPEMDFNFDCIVNMSDFALFTQRWMECTKPIGCK